MNHQSHAGLYRPGAYHRTSCRFVISARSAGAWSWRARRRHLRETDRHALQPDGFARADLRRLRQRALGRAGAGLYPRRPRCHHQPQQGLSARPLDRPRRERCWVRRCSRARRRARCCCSIRRAGLDSYRRALPNCRLGAVDATAIAREHGIGSDAVVIVNTTILGAYARLLGVPLDGAGEAYASLGLSDDLAAAQHAYDAVRMRDAVQPGGDAAASRRRMPQPPPVRPDDRAQRGLSADPHDRSLEHPDAVVSGA